MAPGIAISVKSSVNSKALEDNTEAVEAKELGTFGREESPKNSLEKDPYAADIQHDVRVFGKAMQESPMDLIRKGITAFTLDTEGDRFSSGESIMDEKIKAAEKKLRSVLSRHENNSGNTRNITGGFGDYNGFIKNDNGIPITYDSNASLSIQMGLKLVSIDILKRKSQHSLGPTKFGSLVSVEISKNSKQQEMEENNQHGRYSFRKRTELSLHPYTKFTWTKPGQVPYGKYNKIDLSVLYEPGKNKKKHIIINKAAGEGGEGSSGEYYNGDAEESAESDVIKSAELLNEKIDKPTSRTNSRISQRGKEHRPRAVKRTFKKRRKAAIGKKRVKTWINQLRSQEGSKTYGTHKKNVAIKDRDGLDMDIDFDMDSSLSDLNGISEISRILRSQNSFLSEQKNEEYNSGINKGIKEKSANTVKHNINVDDSDDSGSIGFVKGYHYNFARQNLGTQGKKRPRVILTDASSKKSSIEQSDSPVSRLEKRKNKKPLLNKKSIRGVLPASFLRRVYRSNSNVSSSSDYGSRKATIKPKTTFRKANRPKTGIGRKRGSRHSKRENYMSISSGKDMENVQSRYMGQITFMDVYKWQYPSGKKAPLFLRVAARELRHKLPDNKNDNINGAVGKVEYDSPYKKVTNDSVAIKIIEVWRTGILDVRRVCFPRGESNSDVASIRSGFGESSSDMVDYEYDDRGSPPKYNGNTTSKRKTKAKIRAPEGRIKFNSKKQRGVINVNRFRKTVRGRRKEVDVNKRSDGIRVDGGMEKEPFGYQLFGVEGRKYSNMVGGGTAGDNPGVITFKSRKNRQRTLKTYYDNSNPTTNNETPKSILPSYMKSKLQGRPKPAARVVDKNKAEYIRSLFPERKNNKSKNRKNTQNRYENENENVNICANVSSNEDNGFAKAVDKKEHLGISDIYQLPSGIYFDKSSFVGKGMVSTILNRLESLLFKNEREINTNTDTEISSTLVNERDIITWLNSLLYSPFDGEFGQTMLIFDKIASYSNVLSTEKSSENLKLMASKMDELSALIKTHMSTLSVEIPAEKKSFFFLNIFVVVLVMKCVLAKVQLSINQDDFGVGENHVARRELHSIVGPKPATIAFGSSNLNTTSDKVALFEQKLNGMLSLCLSSLVELVVDNLDVNKITRKWKYLNTGDSLSIIIGGDDRWSKGENSEGWNIELLVALINLTNYDALCYSNSSIDPAISTFYKSKISGCENIWTALEKHPTISRKNLWNFFIKMMLPLTQFSKKGISSSSTFPYYLGLSPNQTNINNVNSSFQCFLEGFLVDKCDVVSRKSGLSVLHKLTTSNLGTKHTKSIIGGGKCVCQESGFSLALTTRLVYKLHVLYFEEHGKTELQGPADFTYSEFPETCECSEYFFKNRMTMVYLRILYDTFNLWSACLNPTFLKEWRVLVSKILPTKTFSNTSSHNNKNNIAAANTHPNAVEVESGKKTSVLYSLMLFDVILKTTNKDIINPLRLIQQKFNIVDDLLNSVGTNNTSDSAMTNSFASDLLMENWLTTAKIITVRLINFDLEKLNPGTKRRDLSHKNTPNNKKRTDGYYYYDCQRLCIYQWNNYLQKYTQLYLASSCKSFTLQICIDRLLKSATRLLTTSLDHASNANINTGSILPPTGFLGLVYLLLNASLFKSISLGSEIFTFNPQRLALELLEDILTIICKIQKQEHQYVTGALTNANPVNPRHEFGDRTLPNFDSCSNNASKYSGNDISAELHGNNNHQEYSVVFSKIIEVLQTYWVADLRSSIIGMNSKISTNYGKAYSYNLVLLNKRVKALTLLLQILVGHSKMSRYIASNNHNDNNTNPDNTNTTIANNVAFNYNWDSYFLDYGKNSFSIIIDKYLRRLTISMFMSNAIQYLDFEDFARLKSEIVHWWFVMLLDLNLQHYVYKFITEIQLYLANSSSLGNNVRYNQGVGDVDFPVDLLLNLNCSRATSGGGKSNNTLDFLLLESLFKNISNSHYLQSAPVSASAPALVSISTPTPGSTPIMTTTTVPTNLQTSNTLRSLFKTMFDSANEILSNKSLLPHKVSVDDYKTLVFRVKVLFNSYFPSYFIL